MQINEEKINKLVERNLYRLLKEDFKKSLNGEDFDQQFIEKNRKNRPGNWKKQTGVGLLKGAAVAAGAAAVGGVLGVPGGGGILAILGLGKLGFKLGRNLLALNRVKQLKFPLTAASAMEYAKFAAAERVEAQELCKKLQQNIQNAIAAYNKAYKGTIDTQNNSFFGNTQAKFQDRGKMDSVTVDWDKDFTNKNAGQNESKIYESEAGDLNAKTFVISANDYFNEFQKIGASEAFYNVIDPLKGEYVDAYGLWMQWTRYINVLVHTYGEEGLTWDAVINSNNMSNVESMVKTFMKDKLGIKTGGDVNTYSGGNKELKMTVRVKSTNYVIGKIAYTLLKDDSSPKYYAAPQFTVINSTRIQQEMPLTMVIKPDMIKREIPTKDGKTVYLLSNDVLRYIKPIMNGGTAQEI